ncbi:hypothetical protein GQ457_17G001400 [Hibiscus cannabinus]
MGENITAGSFFQYPPSGFPIASPLRTSPLPTDHERYLVELLAEKQKLGPFTPVLPLSTMLLIQEIRRVSGLGPSLVDHERFEHGSPFRSFGHHPDGRRRDLEGWSVMRTEVTMHTVYEHTSIENGHLDRLAPIHAASMGWPGLPIAPTIPIVKRVVRLDVPVDQYPSVRNTEVSSKYNFVGRILGPRGNSLKRVEVVTGCRVYIRGKGSIKDSVKEEKLKDKPGYKHLNETLHVLVEAEFPEDVINSRLDYAIAILENLLNPVLAFTFFYICFNSSLSTNLQDEMLDNYKKQQLRELALLNGTLREDSPSLSPSISPFNNAGMERTKMGR